MWYWLLVIPYVYMAFWTGHHSWMNSDDSGKTYYTSEREEAWFKAVLQGIIWPVVLLMWHAFSVAEEGWGKKRRE